MQLVIEQRCPSGGGATTVNRFICIGKYLNICNIHEGIVRYWTGTCYRNSIPIYFIGIIVNRFFDTIVALYTFIGSVGSDKITTGSEKYPISAVIINSDCGAAVIGCIGSIRTLFATQF